MLKKNKRASSGKLGEINVTEIIIELANDDKPFKSRQFQARRNTSEFKLGEIDKQLKGGVIELSIWQGNAPVLLVNTKDGKLRFCIDYRKHILMAF